MALPTKLTEYGLRTFKWERTSTQDTGYIYASACMPYVEEPEQKLSLESGHRCIIRILRTITPEFDWRIRKDSATIVSKGLLKAGSTVNVGLHKIVIEPTLENAALECMRAFYTIVTEAKFSAARTPKAGRRIAIKVNRISPKEYFSYPETIRKYCQVIGIDDREDTIFVIGLPKAHKEEFITTIKTIKAGRGYSIPNIFNSTVTTPENVTLHESLDWRMYNVHENIEGEVYCPVCRNLYRNIHDMSMRYVQTIGPLCGACIDHLQIDGEFSFDGLIDV